MPFISASIPRNPLEDLFTGRRQTVAAAVRPGLLHDAGGQFSRNFDRRSFRFEHGLGDHPMFELAQLLDLAARQPRLPGYTFWSDAVYGAGDKWRNGKGTVVEALVGIANNNSIVQFCHVEQDPVLGPLVRELMSGIVSYSGTRMRNDLIRGEATLLIASPRRITHYHADGACGYLVQIAGGGKLLSVFERDDRVAVPEHELEAFHCGDFNSIAFKEEHRGRAAHYPIGGGDGVHIPCVAPHWAQNGSEVSVAISFSFHLRSAERRKRLYQVNRRLRRWGITPTAPGLSPWRDRIKLAAKDTLQALRAGRAQPAVP